MWIEVRQFLDANFRTEKEDHCIDPDSEKSRFTCIDFNMFVIYKHHEDAFHQRVEAGGGCY